MGARLFFGGSSSSSKGGDQTSIDGRITTGPESVAVSVNNSSGNTISATTTDFGAVSASMDLALKGYESITDVAKQTVSSSSRANDQANSLLSGALQSMSGQQEQFTKALENIKAGDARPLMYVAIGVVGLVAVFAFARKG